MEDLLPTLFRSTAVDHAAVQPVPVWSSERFLGWICTVQILHSLLTTAGEELDDLDNDLSVDGLSVRDVNIFKGETKEKN